jgi:DNA-binding NarL/FixJ family response regulator
MRAVIAEDSTLLREGIVRLLTEAGFEVAAAVDNGPALVSAIVELAPEIAIVDVRMPPTFRDEGLRAAIEARRLRPAAPILVLSQYVEERYAGELLETGANAVGYLLKDRVADVRDFIAALKSVAAGGTVVDPEVVAQLLTRQRRSDRLNALSGREREVLGLMAEGKANNAIAAQLFISEGTVEKHVASIFAKLGLDDTPDVHRRVLAVLTYLRERLRPAELRA